MPSNKKKSAAEKKKKQEERRSKQANAQALHEHAEKFREKLVLIPGVTNVIERAFFLPRIAMANGVVFFKHLTAGIYKGIVAWYPVSTA